MRNKIFLIVIATCAVVSGQQPNGTCGISGVPLDTSLTNPYTLPPQSDYYYSFHSLVWGKAGLPTGTIIGIQPERTGHGNYVSHSFQQGSYYIWSVSETNFFTHEQQVRELLTNVTFECLGGSTSHYSTYYLKIPLVDTTAPRFEYGQMEQYNFTIPSNWDLKRPITELVNITVCDNDFELRHGKMFSANTTHSSLVHVELHPPLPHEYQPASCSRLNLYLTNPFPMGTELSINLTVSDPSMNVGYTTVFLTNTSVLLNTHTFK